MLMVNTLRQHNYSLGDDVFSLRQTFTVRPVSRIFSIISAELPKLSADIRISRIYSNYKSWTFCYYAAECPKRKCGWSKTL